MVGKKTWSSPIFLPPMTVNNASNINLHLHTSGVKPNLIIFFFNTCLSGLTLLSAVSWQDRASVDELTFHITVECYLWEAFDNVCIGMVQIWTIHMHDSEYDPKLYKAVPIAINRFMWVILTSQDIQYVAICFSVAWVIDILPFHGHDSKLVIFQLHWNENVVILTKF